MIRDMDKQNKATSPCLNDRTQRFLSKSFQTISSARGIQYNINSARRFGCSKKIPNPDIH